MGAPRQRLKLSLATAAAAVAVIAVVAGVRFYAAGLHPIYLAATPQTAEALIRYVIHDYAGAAKALRAHLGRHPGDDSGNDSSYRALLHGELDVAERQSREVLRADPGATGAAITLAQVLVERNRGQDALDVLRNLLASAPQRPIDAMALAAITQSRLDQYDAAIASWQRALRYGEPGERISLYALALETADSVLRAPERPGREALLAQLFRYLQFFDRLAAVAVRRHARAALVAGDHPADSWIAYADMERRAHRPNAALRDFERAAAVDERNPYVHYYLAGLYSDRGDLAAELRHALLAYQLGPDAESAQWLLALLADKFGDYRQVISIAEQRLARAPEYAVLLELGRAHGALGDYPAAIADYGHALELQPRDALALANLAYWHAKAGHRPEAIELARRAAALRPDWSYPLKIVGRELGEDFRYAEAIPMYEAAFRIEPPRDEELAYLCTLYHGASRWQQALQCFQTVLRYNPSNARAQRMLGEARNNAALAAARQGRPSP